MLDVYKRQALAASSDIKFTPIDIFAEKNIGTVFEHSFISAICFSLRPVVATTAGHFFAEAYSKSPLKTDG